MESDASPEVVLRKRVIFDEAWRKFVDGHESYLELLNSPTVALVFGKGTNDLQRTAETKALPGLLHVIMAQGQRTRMRISWHVFWRNVREQT